MQSARDIRRLTSQYSDAPSGTVVVVLKCAAGLAMLLIMAAGPWIVLTTGEAGVPAEAYQPAAASPDIAESRRAFEERRRRAQDKQETAKAALNRD